MFTGACALCALLPALVSAETMTNDQLPEVVAFLDSAGFVMSRRELKAVDNDPVPELVTIALDKRKQKDMRLRAMGSLSLFPNDKRVEKAFKRMIKNTRNRSYYPVLVNAYLEAFGEEAVPAILPLLTDRDPKVRRLAVKALGTFGGQVGYDALVTLFKSERHPGVRSTLVGFVGD